MLPLEWADQVVAPPGYMLVERVRMPEQKGLIWLPDNYRLSTRASEATIVSIGPGVDSDFQVGDRVVLSSTVGKSIDFGTDDRTLWLVKPEMTLARVLGEVGSLEKRDKPDLEAVAKLDPDMEQAVEEGDPRGIR